MNPLPKFALVTIVGALAVVALLYLSPETRTGLQQPPILRTPTPGSQSGEPSTYDTTSTPTGQKPSAREGRPLEDPRVTLAREECDLDLNDDGNCDSQDTMFLRDSIGACKDGSRPNLADGAHGKIIAAKYYERADIDDDGCVTWADQEQLFPMFIWDSDKQPCDFDRDGDCDVDDFKIFQTHEHTCFDDPEWVTRDLGMTYNPQADASRNGCVLGEDRPLLFAQFSRGLEDLKREKEAR